MLFNRNKQLPKVYTKKDIEQVERHIDTYFGKTKNVLHEIASPDIHVDIFIIEPTIQRNYYTLVTCGMGAHKMNVPKELESRKINRAELLITLPADWKIDNEEEEWYWPIRWLKILARLPINNNTWLGFGHTIPNGKPFANNTSLSGIMLTMPYLFGNDAIACKLMNGTQIVFYQLLPITDDEMNFKIANNAEALENLFSNDFNFVVDIKRKSVINN